jgi:hypothetical protein
MKPKTVKSKNSSALPMVVATIVVRRLGGWPMEVAWGMTESLG